MLVLALSLAVFRTIYLDAVPAAVLPHDAAAVAYDTIVAYLRLGLRAVLVLALVVAAGAFLSGPSTTAVGDSPAPHRSDRPATRRRGEAGLRTGPVGTWVEPTSSSCGSAPSPWPSSPWCSGASPPAR